MKKSGDGKDSSMVGYILGIVALVLAFFSPFPGFVLGIIGLVQSKRKKNPLSKKGKILNIIAIIVSVILIAASIYLYVIQGNLLESFPIS